MLKMSKDLLAKDGPKRHLGLKQINIFHDELPFLNGDIKLLFHYVRLFVFEFCFVFSWIFSQPGVRGYLGWMAFFKNQLDSSVPCKNIEYHFICYPPKQSEGGKFATWHDIPCSSLRLSPPPPTPLK